MKRRLLLSVFSGLLLALCFPKFNFSFLAWFALIPLLTAIGQCESRRQAVLCGFVSGVLFFGLSIYWIMYVAFVGWVLLLLLESLFLILIG